MLVQNGRLAFGANITMFGLDGISGPGHEWMQKNIGGVGPLASVPRGYGSNGLQPALTGGSMASRIGIALAVSGSAPINQGVSLGANGAMLTFEGVAPLAALVNMAATGPITFSGSANAFGVAYMDSTGGMRFAGTAGLGGLFSISADGTLTFGGSAVTHSLAHLVTTEQTGVMTEATITAAVWSALAAAYNAPGTMGEKLNDAGSASNPWTEIIEGALTAAEIQRIIFAAVAGKTSQAGSIVSFRDVADTKDRITGTVDTEGNRTAVVLDGE